MGHCKIYTPHETADQGAVTYMQDGVCDLQVWHALCFPGEYVKDNASRWFRAFYKAGIFICQKTSKGMSQGTYGY